ncbi:hypothetical protein NL676_028046 [Syzygium grande]|nr:hypothetical protein NL676_028046 [Syzygium grande]
MYSLSSSFMARQFLPLEIILLIIFLSMTYWMSGLKPELGVLALAPLVLLSYVLVSQGISLRLGAAVTDAKQDLEDGQSHDVGVLADRSPLSPIT